MRKIHMIAVMSTKAPQKPTTGEMTIGTRIFSLIPCQCTAEEPAIAPPISPPNSACEDDEGNPKYQVTRFQTIAPTRPEATMTRPC